MVFCGKRSKSCQECRSQRRRCDLLRPSCTQCIRKGLRCYGYRDVQEIEIRDERENVLRRINAKSTRAGIQEKQRNDAHISPTELILQPPIEDRAMGMFMSHYIFGKSKSFQYISAFYAGPGMDERVSACIKAVSLAEFASHAKSSDLLRNAREWYSISLRLTNLALQSKTEAAKDSTLLGILLLDLFEKILAIHTKRPISSITEHVSGAAKLLQIRGVQQFNSSLGFNMFMQSVSLLLESCVQCKVRVPHEINSLLNYAKSITNPNNYNWLIFDAFEEFIALRADVNAGALIDPRDIIAEAQRQEDKCAVLCTLFKAEWHYNTVFTDDLVSAYEGIYHLYTASFNSVRTWNTIRIGRIMINEIIREQFVLGSSTIPPLLNPAEHVVQFKAAGDAIAEMTFEICGCIPQFSTAIPSSSPTIESQVQSLALQSSLSSDSSWSNTSKREYTYSEQTSAYSLIYSLYVVGRSPGRPLKLHLWAIDRLRYIGNVIGLSDANMVAELLEHKSDIDPWSVGAMLGGHQGQN